MGHSRFIAQHVWKLSKVLWEEWEKDNASLLAAAIAFYATFSLGPLLVLLLALAGVFFERGEAAAHITNLLATTLSPATAAAVGRLLESVAESDDTAAGLLSTVLLVAGASGVFTHVRTALNIVMSVPTPEEREIVTFLRSRLLGIAVVVAILLVFAASFTLTAVLAFAGRSMPSLAAERVVAWRLLDFAIASTITFFVFGAILKFVPDVRIKWRYAAKAAGIAAVLFTAGRMLLATLFSRSALSSLYGAATSFFVILVAVYFAALILLLSAEITELLARRDLEFRLDRRIRKKLAAEAESAASQ